MIENISALSELIKSGIALIPLNQDKEPYAKFKSKPIIDDLQKLNDTISYYERRSGDLIQRVGIRCGKASSGLVSGGGLVCIDIDSKYKDGFSGRFWNDVQTLFPELWDRFRIDKTPSGGLHFYYIVKYEEEISTKNIASRYATLGELDINPKRKDRCFIELKAGDGTLVTTYPSIGYELIKKCESSVGSCIGELSLDEHLELIDFCYTYDEIIKQEEIKISKSTQGIYIEGKTPFDCFNISDSASLVLDELGWRRWKSYGSFDTFIKPGNKKNRVGATFNPVKRTYAILTTGSGIETKCYKASTLLVKEKFNGDVGAAYSFLVSQGFGNLKPNIEKNEIRRSLKLGNPLPANISQDGLILYENEKLISTTKYPYGEFWFEEKESEYSINRELLLRICNNLGFRLNKERPVFIEDGYISEVNDTFFYDKLKLYINQKDNHELLDKFEEFLQKSGKFTISRLEELDLSIVLRSTKKESYKFYSNCYVCITKDNYEVLNYDKLQQLIWKKDIKNREFKFLEKFNYGLYWDFIKNSIGWSNYIMKCIGFYAHDHRDEESYLIYTLEKCEDSKDGGGSGKNVFWKLFSLTTSFKSTAASMIKKDNQFLQSWNGERVFVMSDLPKTFDLIFFKDMVTDGAVVRKLYKDEYNVDVADMAKLGVSGNYSFDDADPGIKRRLRIIEFSDYYTVRGGVKNVHDGKMFPKDWNSEDYLLFDNIMMTCIQEYLIGDSIIEKNEISDTGWAKKQEQNYKYLFELIKEGIDSWVKLGKISNKVFNDFYHSFREENNIAKPLSAFTINKAITEYCEHFKIPFLHNYKKSNGEKSDGVTWKEGLVTVKGRLFGVEVEKFLNRNPLVSIVKEDNEDDLPF